MYPIAACLLPCCIWPFEGNWKVHWSKECENKSARHVDQQWLAHKDGWSRHQKLSFTDARSVNSKRDEIRDQCHGQHHLDPFAEIQHSGVFVVAVVLEGDCFPQRTPAWSNSTLFPHSFDHPSFTDCFTVSRIIISFFWCQFDSEDLTLFCLVKLN